MAHPLETIWNSLVKKKVETEDFLRASMNRPETAALEDEYFPYTIKENRHRRNDWGDGGGDFTDTSVSDARHQASASNVSDALVDRGHGQFFGDSAAFLSGLYNERGYPSAIFKDGFYDATRRLEDDVIANWKGSFGTPYGATAEGIFKENMGGLSPEEYKRRYIIDSHMSANNIWR